MVPRPAPDLDVRRDRIVGVARRVAEAEGWNAVTMRRVASEIGVTQPVIYSAFAGGRQALVDAVALRGFDAVTTALEAVPPRPRARLAAYLDFANAQPRVYEAMFALPSGLAFGNEDTPAALQRAFGAVRAAFPGADDALAELAWASIHGLATLEISGRLPSSRSRARLEHAVQLLAARQG